MLNSGKWNSLVWEGNSSKKKNSDLEYPQPFSQTQSEERYRVLTQNLKSGAETPERVRR